MSPTSKNISKGKVFVGLSGGVDSAVSAALLKEQGYDVTGVFIKVWQPSFLPCTWREERRDAMRVADKLEIPFLFFDFSEEYKKSVADTMIREYKRGRTPNPDVLCNREVKFGAFWKKAKAMGANYIATGHYLSGENDQRYFLWMLKQKDFEHTLFPVGRMPKSKVRLLANKFNLPVSEKKDSQGICFLGNVDIEDFLSHFIKTKTGKVLDLDGNVIGKHRGALYYTLGERRGFEVTHKGAYSRPLYIVAKDMKKNTLTVSENPKIFTPKEIKLEQLNWIRKPKSENLKAQVRYKQEKFDVRVQGHNVEFSVSQVAASGQSIVFYENDELIGGAIIS